MLMIVLILAGLVAGAMSMGVAVRRAEAPDEVDRFHQARAMTTSWSDAYQGARSAHVPAGSREE